MSKMHKWNVGLQDEVTEGKQTRQAVLELRTYQSGEAMTLSLTNSEWRDLMTVLEAAMSAVDAEQT